LKSYSRGSQNSDTQVLLTLIENSCFGAFHLNSHLHVAMATVTYSALTLGKVAYRTTAVSRSGRSHRAVGVKCTAQSLSLGHSMFLLRSPFIYHYLPLHPQFLCFSWQRREVSRSFQEGERYSPVPLHLLRSPHSSARLQVSR